jgi:hypothetical protein
MQNGPNNTMIPKEIKAQTGKCLLHNQWSLDELLQGKRVLFEKWSWKEFPLAHSDGRKALFYLIPERAVWAVLDENKEA